MYCKHGMAVVLQRQVLGQVHGTRRTNGQRRAASTTDPTRATSPTGSNRTIGDIRSWIQDPGKGQGPKQQEKRHQHQQMSTYKKANNQKQQQISTYNKNQTKGRFGPSPCITGTFACLSGNPLFLVARASAASAASNSWASSIDMGLR